MTILELYNGYDLSIVSRKYNVTAEFLVLCLLQSLCHLFHNVPSILCSQVGVLAVTNNHTVMVLWGPVSEVLGFFNKTN